MRDVVSELCGLYERAAHMDYIGESISQLAHGLQCAALAEQAKADDALVVAALLHDVGHFCASAARARSMNGYGVHDHERLGAEYVRELGFPSRVSKLILGHVQAKRYLVATHAAYAARLSPASAETLRQQGGAMSPAEVAAFAVDPDFKDLLRLRAWDEEAKRVDWQPVGFAAYAARMERLLAVQQVVAPVS